MPLSRYQIRNVYSLADQELYKAADKDDPEALLEGVAMAGLVGVLRQLGDLAEFAAEVFHDLHEEVMATAARGHSLIVRMQQLEAEFPSIERKLLTQTSHTSLLYNSGVDWHPNLCMDQNLITRRDLPRFIMDSYEECCGPPRLFLLDKFDVAGAGTCLKRYTDPSFFKTESISPNNAKLGAQREKKIRRVKKRTPRWKNGETPESFPSSHAKLHQLFLEERLWNDGNDPERRVKLKRRQFTGSFLDRDNKKSYMEKFVDMIPRELEMATSIDGCDSGLEIVEIGTVSPLKESMKTVKSLCLSPNTREPGIKSLVHDISKRKLNGVIDSGALEVSQLSHGSDACKILRLVKGEECIDMESDSQVSIDDGFASDIDNYADALATIESEIETDLECKRTSHYLNAKPIIADFYESEGQKVPGSLSSGSPSFGNSTTSEDGNNFFKDRENSSCSMSVNSMAESTKDLEAAVVVVPSVTAPNSDPHDIFFMSESIPGNETEVHAIAGNGVVEADDFTKNKQNFGETPNTSTHAGLNAIFLPMDMKANMGENSFPSPELEEEYSSFADSSIVNQGAFKRTDIGHWSSGEHPLDVEGGCISCVRAETSLNLPNTPYDLVQLPQIESRKTDSVSSVEEHINELGITDLDVCLDIGQPLAHPLVPKAKHQETMNPTDANAYFFISSTRENSEDQYSAPERTQNLNIQQEFHEMNNWDHEPLFDSASVALPSSEDYSTKEILSDVEAEEKTYTPIVGLTEPLPPIFNGLQAFASESYLSDISAVEETTECHHLEAGMLGAITSGDEPNGKVVFGSADDEMVNSPIKTGKSSLVPYLKEIHNQFQKLAEATQLEHHHAEAGDRCPRKSSNIDGDSFSIDGKEKEAPLYDGILEGASISQKFALFHQGNSEPVGAQAYLDDSQTQAKQNESISKHDFHNRHADKSKDLSHETFLSGMPSKINITSNFVSASENNSTLDHDTAMREHIEIVTNNFGQVDIEHVLQKKVMPLSSSEFLDAEKLKDQPVLLIEHCLQSGEELIPVHNADLATQKDPDAAQDAPVDSNSNMSPNGSPALTLLDDSSAQVVQNDAKLIHSVEAPFTSESGTQDMELMLSYQIHLVKKEFYPGSLSHDNPEPMGPLQDGDSEVKTLCDDDVSSQLVNYAKQFQTLEHFDRDRCAHTAAFYSHAQLSQPNLQPQSAEMLGSSRNPFVEFKSVGPSNMLSGITQVISKVENPGQLVPPSFPVTEMLPVEPPIGLDPPPLPPLPPMQWRLGRFQSSSTTIERQMVQHTLGSVQPMGLCTTNVETEVVSPDTQAMRGYSDGNAAEQGVATLPKSPVPDAVSDVSSQNNIIGIREDSHSFTAAQTPLSSQNGNQALEESCQPSMNLAESGSIVEAHADIVVEEENLSTEVGSENGQPEHISLVSEKEAVKSHGELFESSIAHNYWHSQQGFEVPETGSILPCTHDGILINADETLHNRLPRPRNPLIDEVVAIDKSKLRKVERVKPLAESKGDEGESLLEQLQLRKVGERTKPQAESKTEEIGPLLEQLQLRKIGERVKPETNLQAEETESPRVQLRKVVGRAHSMVGPKTEDRGSLLEQIKNKSFNLRPAAMARPNIQGPSTNLRVAAILQKASNIRQAMAGSDEEDDADNWSDC